MRPVAIPSHIRVHCQPKEKLVPQLAVMRSKLERLQSLEPDVSVIIPAFNEEENILKTLSSLAASVTRRQVEVIVVDNNSTDATASLAAAAGAMVIPCPVQGITPTRNAGLQAARGQYILNADADTIYPPAWIDRMVMPLLDEPVALVYGKFAFLPTRGTPRIVYFGYEHLADLSRWKNRKFGEEAVNIYGFNSAFRRIEGLQAGGFDHPPGTNEDGWLGLKLRNTLHKSLYLLNATNALVWTTDRRIHADGGILKGFVKRIVRHL